MLLPGMHGTGELFDEFMRMIPGPKHIEALCYPADAIWTYPQGIDAVKAFVPESDEFYLLAESFSTPLAILFAATNPPNLRGLILCAGFATSPIPGWRRSFVSFIAPLAFRLPPPRIAMSRFLVGPDAPESLHTAVRSAIRSVRPTVLTARLRQVLEVDVRLALGNVLVPILYIQALQDQLVGPSCLEEIEGIKPQVAVAKIRGPHLILQREPQKSADFVARFMDRLSGAGH